MANLTDPNQFAEQFMKSLGEDFFKISSEIFTLLFTSLILGQQVYGEIIAVLERLQTSQDLLPQEMEGIASKLDEAKSGLMRINAHIEQVKAIKEVVRLAMGVAGE